MTPALILAIAALVFASLARDMPVICAGLWRVL